MAIGDCYPVETGECTDLFYLDTGMYDTAEYGAVYILTGERSALIDTGIGQRHDLILDAMDSVGIAPEELDIIAPTHVHLDHAGGAGYLARDCPNATVVVHERGARHLADPTRLIKGTKAAVGDQWQFYEEPLPVPEDRMQPLTDGDVVDLGDHQLHAHHAPGHASHQLVFEDPANDAVFTADAAGIYVPTIDAVRETSPPSEFNLEQCLADIELLKDIDPKTLLYAHFGPTPTADRFAEYADVLTDWVATVEAKRTELESDGAVVEYFAENTSMVDVWGELKARAETAMNTRGVLQYLDAQPE
ncbi:MBL fold metallo-hydrolase [Halocatena pleomorpha]|uniref:MBL fold metallo-hydrolase n=1 Tax=Halocatena pleomorpha TaxID=1785090 RepID=A0A3P3RJ42_9EURY|nr:MBL fold metallo-hydrolase [Halocatena pleomorpha]RRJ33546.1 MBL fold metallo-hydrolase [Halocatena pleomorpha]